MLLSLSAQFCPNPKLGLGLLGAVSIPTGLFWMCSGHLPGFMRQAFPLAQYLLPMGLHAEMHGLFLFSLRFSSGIHPAVGFRSFQ